MNLKPRGKRIVIRLLEAETQSKGGIILPDVAQEQPRFGKVVAIGEAVTSVELGSTVLYSQFTGQEIELDSVRYRILSSKDILATLEE